MHCYQQMTILYYYPHIPIGKVWIYCLLFVCSFFVCTVTDFCAEDKVIGIKFCTAVHRRPRQGITYQRMGHVPARGPCAGRFNQHTGHTHPHVNIIVEMRRRKCSKMRHSWNIAQCVDIGPAYVDRGQSPLTYLYIFQWIRAYTLLFTPLFSF